MKCFNIISFYGEELLTPCPTPKMEDHSLSAVHDCLFNILTATLHIWRLFILPKREDMPCYGDRDSLIMEQILEVGEIKRKLL
jgi:hypothetical protein